MAYTSCQGWPPPSPTRRTGPGPQAGLRVVPGWHEPWPSAGERVVAALGQRWRRVGPRQSSAGLVAWDPALGQRWPSAPASQRRPSSGPSHGASAGPALGLVPANPALGQRCPLSQRWSSAGSLVIQPGLTQRWLPDHAVSAAPALVPGPSTQHWPRASRSWPSNQRWASAGALAPLASAAPALAPHPVFLGWAVVVVVVVFVVVVVV